MLTKTLQPIHQKVLQLLAQKGVVRSDELPDLVDRYQTMAKIAESLISQKKITEEQLAKLFSVAYDIPFVHLTGRNIAHEVLTIIPEEMARRYLLIAYEKKDQVVKLAIGQPYRLSSSPKGPLHELEEKLLVEFELAITTKLDINWALNSYNQVTIRYGETKKEKSNSSQTLEALPFVNLKYKTIPKTTLEKFPIDIAQKYKMVVFESPSDKELHVALVYPNDPQTQEILDYIEQKNGMTIKRFQASSDDFESVMKRYKEGQEGEGKTRPILTQGAPLTDEQELVPELTSKELFEIKYEGDVPIVIEKATREVERLAAKTGAEDLEENNLDKVLKMPMKLVGDLVKVVVTGYVPKIVAAIIGFAVNEEASDIHIEPMEKYLRIRFRIDGLLNEVIRLPLAIQPSVVSRIKILSNLKIDEQRIPQDGRFDAQSQNHLVDLRVSTLPTVHGEKVVIRLLDKSSGLLTLEQLGLTGSNFDRVIEAVKKPWGVIMATGPTGSGKSTTLYAILNRISSLKVNVITIEDPVEYEIPGINQTQVKPKIGFSFAEGLRSVLRQDPNVIMVGEVRDRETAELVTHAALTGHLVLTTLHTNDAPGALPRLINMGVEPFLITSAINAIIAQRLVRKLCQKCKKLAKLPEPVLEKAIQEVTNLAHRPDQPDQFVFYEAGGCDGCTEGFKGRIGIYEVITISEAIELAALQRKPASELATIAIKEGMITMRQDGILKAVKGLTTIDEVMKATSA